jgi:4-hydroxybenzoate polyprenyltransferase
MAAHTALGWILAVGLVPAFHGDRLGPALWALLLWVVFLNGGTLAINSVYDEDEGDIGYLNAPPKPPRHLLAFSLGLMAMGQLLAFTLPTGYRWAYAACFAMSIAYSVPPLRLKAVGGVDWVINMIGFGTLTPYAGWAATGRPVNAAGAMVLLAFCPLFAALYPLTQLYQWDEDMARGDRTLAIMLGRRESITVAIGATALAFLMMLIGARLSFAKLWQWLAILAALGAWLAILLPWHRDAESRSSAQDQRGFYAALGAWALTDIAVVVAFGM